jgi:hypothetical protein
MKRVFLALVVFCFIGFCGLSVASAISNGLKNAGGAAYLYGYNNINRFDTMNRCYEHIMYSRYDKKYANKIISGFLNGRKKISAFNYAPYRPYIKYLTEKCVQGATDSHIGNAAN